MQKGFTPMLIVIFVGLVLGGYVIYQRYTSPNPVLTPEISNQPPEIATASPTSTPAASLKVQPKNSPKPSPTMAAYSSSVKLESVSPNVASSGEEIKLLGSGFGTVIGKVYLYNQILGPSTVFADVTPNRWTETEIKITVPPAVGNQTINFEIVHKDGTKSNRVQFQIKGGQPRIDNFSPNNAEPLQEITISGKEFGVSSGSVNIHEIGGGDSSPLAQCQINSWGDTSIKCKLPSTVNNGTEYGFEIVSSDNRRSSFKYYKVGS